jgi:uncharacterized protein YjbJ (UPF0337 family)
MTMTGLRVAGVAPGPQAGPGRPALPAPSPSTERFQHEQGRIEGGIRHIRGRAKTAVGAVTGHPMSQVDGAIDQVAGAAQYAYGQARDTARDLRRDGEHMIDEARDRGRALADETRERGQRYRDEAVHRGRAVVRRAEDNKTATLLVAAAAFSFGWLARRTR